MTTTRPRFSARYGPPQRYSASAFLHLLNKLERKPTPHHMSINVNAQKPPYKGKVNQQGNNFCASVLRTGRATRLKAAITRTRSDHPISATTDGTRRPTFTAGARLRSTNSISYFCTLPTTHITSSVGRLLGPKKNLFSPWIIRLRYWKKGDCELSGDIGHVCGSVPEKKH